MCPTGVADTIEMQRREAKDAFTKCDVSGNGTIEQGELFVAMGMLNLKLRMEELQRRVQQTFQDADRDSSGSLTFEEFEQLYNRVYMSDIDFGSFV